ETLDKIGEPLLAGIHNSESERQSLLATFPRLRDLEEKHGSLIRGMLAERRATNDQRPPTTDRERDEERRQTRDKRRETRDKSQETRDKRQETRDKVLVSSLQSPVSSLQSPISRSPFVTLRGGVGDLVGALVERLDGRLLAGRGVAAIEHAPAAD